MAERKPRQRAVQKRAEETRQNIIATAIHLFSTRGYEGTSIRAIEIEAGLKRGLVGYHFGTKDELWKEAMAVLFSRLPGIDELQPVDSLPADARFRFHISRFIQGSAANPEVSRVIIQEGRAGSWRLDHLLEHFVKPRLTWLEEITGQPLDPHVLYILIGAATLVFDVAAECEAIFNVNPMDESFVSEHARRVCDLLLGSAGPLVSLGQ